MRYIDETIRARLLQAQKTLYNNANPSMEIIAVRPETPIRNKDLWQEVIVSADTTATKTSVAVRKTSFGAAERAYVAYISGGNLYVKEAAMTYPVSQMQWTTTQTITGCIDVALEFDGTFTYDNKGNIVFHTESLPWLFYVTAGGQLMAGKLGSTPESLAGANVENIDVIRGIADRYKMIDQGIMVFYVISGEIYYREYIDGVWGSQLTVSIAPDNVVDVRAERTWDYRIVLQARTSDGALYEIFSKMEASGWIGTDYIEFSVSVQTDMVEVEYTDTQAEENISVAASAESHNASIYSPFFYKAWNIDDGTGDYGKMIVLEWSEDMLLAGTLPNAFKLTDSVGAFQYAVEVTSDGWRTFYLRFNNFNNFSGNLTLQYIPGSVTGYATAADADSTTFTPTSLVPYYAPKPEPVAVGNIQDWSEA